MTITSATAPPAPDTALLDQLVRAGAFADAAPDDAPDDAAGDFDRLWAATPIRTSSPDGQISLTLTGDVDPRFGFAPGYLQRASRRQVREQLERLLRLTFTARTRCYFRLRSHLAGHPVRPAPTPSTNSPDREYADAIARLRVCGRSADGLVEVTILGMREFHVTLAPTALARGDLALTSALAQAGEAVLGDQAEQVWQLQDRLFFGG